MPGSAADTAGWQLWRPARVQYLWKYRSYAPPLVTVLLPEKTIDFNETASLLWESVDGTRLAEHLVETLEEAYPDVPGDKIACDVLSFLVYCHGEGLIYLNWEPLP